MKKCVILSFFIKLFIMKKLIFTFLKIIGGILGCVIIYAICSLVLPLISIAEKETNEAKTIPIYLYTNGVHTDIVVPTKNEIMDWSEKVPYENTRSQKSDLPYLAIGWGDKGFYLDTPTWADLKASTALKAAFWLSESAMHTTYYSQMKEGDDCKKIMLTPQQYKDLSQFILHSFDQDEKGNFSFIKTDAVYGKNDAFYDAKGSYSFTKTCNTWANDALKVAGQKAALWTATDKGIFRHYQDN